MTYRIVSAGKGGDGKSTVLASVARLLIEAQPDKRVLCVDSDPTANWHYHLLGLDTSPTPSLAKVAEQVDYTAQMVRQTAPMQQLQQLAPAIASVTRNGATFDYLSMGRRQTGEGCYCAVNMLLADYERAVADQYDLLLIDAQEGTELFSRGREKVIDLLLLVARAERPSLTKAHDILQETQRMGTQIKQVVLVVNQVTDEDSLSSLPLPHNIPLFVVPHTPHAKEILQQGVFGVGTDNAVLQSAHNIVALVNNQGQVNQEK